MKSLKQIIYLIGKDLTLQLRTKDAVILIFVFSLLVVLVFCFVFGPVFVPFSLLKIDRQEWLRELGKLAGSVLWVAFTFSGVIGLNRSFDIERRSGALKGLRLTGIDPANLYLAKVFSNALLLFFINICITPITLIFFGALEMVNWVGWLKLTGVIALGTLGFCAGGVLLSSMSSSARGRESLLSVVLFPILFPLIIAASKCTVSILNDKSLLDDIWLILLVGYSLIVLSVSYLLFEYIVEE
ncbi:MAG: heme exporter protein CcmB [Candidatus Poribacteria bacterium]